MSVLAARHAPRAAGPAGEIVSVPIDDARLLCGRRWDWIEAVGTP